MRKLKGITINGEWLGENVVVNGMFRTISSIAPFVMFEFVKLINQIDKLEEAVFIKKFDFLDNNTIEIEFTNSQIDGIADLYFKLHEGTPKLIDKNISFVDFANPQTKEEVHEAVNIEKDMDMHISEENTNENVQEESLLDNTEEIVEEAVELSESREDASTSAVSISDEEEGSEDVIADLYEENLPIKDTEEARTEDKNADELLEAQNSISMLVNDLAKNAKKLPPVQIQIVQTATQQPKQAEVTKVEENNSLSQIQEITEEKNVSIDAQEITNDSVCEQEDEINNEENLLEEEKAVADSTDDECVELVVQANKNQEMSSMEKSEASDFDKFEDDKISEEPTMQHDEDSSIDEHKHQIVSKEDTLDENIEEIIDKNVVQANTVEDVNDNADDEDIQECLAGFYDAPKTEDFEEICTQNTDNVVMQAMLSEMVMLKEELNRLKEEPQKPDVASFWGDNEKKSNYIDDSEADFRIMGSEKRVNASILDEEMFVAGDKLYKWGDMLYLEE